MRGPLSGAAETYNYIEIGIWCATATVVAVVALRRTGPARRDFALASLDLFAFGASDYAEIVTGGEWWTPWWLLLWKGACVLILSAILLNARRRRATAGLTTSGGSG